MDSDQVKEMRDIAGRVQTGLAQLGLCHEIKKAGLTFGVSFRSLQLVDVGDGGPADFGLIEIDTLSLPPRVSAEKLTKPETLHHLTAVIGRPVYYLNTLGLTYCVDLRPASERRGAWRLPQRVDYDASTRPEDIHPECVALGMTRRGPLWVHPERLGNLLLVGAQGFGKSAFLRLLTYQAIKAGWRLALADPEGVTFNPALWRGAGCLIGGNVAASPAEVRALFGLALAELARRSELFNQAPGYPDSLTEYNSVASEPLPRLVLIMDEANTYFSSRALAEQAADLARRARKWGLHCIFAGHNWRASEVPRALSAMVQTRLAFRVSDNTSGRVVLERDGADQLPAQPGRAIIRLAGAYHLTQVYFLDKARLVPLVESLARVEPEEWPDVGDGDDQAELDDRVDDWVDLWGYPWPTDDAGLKEAYEMASDDERKAIIRRLATRGHTKASIQRALFGYTGGAAFDAVLSALVGFE